MSGDVIDFVSTINPKSALEHPAPPCEHFACIHFDKCKADLLACESFHFYVSTGRVVSPKMTWDKSRKGIIKDDVIPTRSRYLKIYGKDSA